MPSSLKRVLACPLAFIVPVACALAVGLTLTVAPFAAQAATPIVRTDTITTLRTHHGSAQAFLANGRPTDRSSTRHRQRRFVSPGTGCRHAQRAARIPCYWPSAPPNEPHNPSPSLPPTMGDPPPGGEEPAPWGPGTPDWDRRGTVF